MATPCCNAACKVADARLRCPLCVRLGLGSAFCGPACFEAAWKMHKLRHAPNLQPMPPQSHTVVYEAVSYARKLEMVMMQPIEWVPGCVLKYEHAYINEYNAVEAICTIMFNTNNVCVVVMRGITVRGTVTYAACVLWERLGSGAVTHAAAGIAEQRLHTKPCMAMCSACTCGLTEEQLNAVLLEISAL